MCANYCTYLNVSNLLFFGQVEGEQPYYFVFKSLLNSDDSYFVKTASIARRIGDFPALRVHTTKYNPINDQVAFGTITDIWKVSIYMHIMDKNTTEPNL